MLLLHSSVIVLIVYVEGVSLCVDQFYYLQMTHFILGVKETSWYILSKAMNVSARMCHKYHLVHGCNCYFLCSFRCGKSWNKERCSLLGQEIVNERERERDFIWLFNLSLTFKVLKRRRNILFIDWPCGDEPASSGWSQGPSTWYLLLSPQWWCHSQLFWGLYRKSVADSRGGTHTQPHGTRGRTCLPHQAGLHRPLASLCSKHPT